MKRSRGLWFALVPALLATVLSPPVGAASDFANPTFSLVWHVDEDSIPNFWGPLALARNGQQEPYIDAPGGKRLVQYFDKGRMEFNAESTSVTSGLLATEMLHGQVQRGDNTFGVCPAPTIPIAGDINGRGVTYASVTQKASMLFVVQSALQTNERLPNIGFGSDGNVTQLAALPPANAGTTIGGYDRVTQHNVTRAFVQYRDNATLGGVDPIGYALSEPFYAQLPVGGMQRTLVVQIFERRVLTYSDTNPDAFKVEMGNIGQQYYRWRYTDCA